MCVHTLTHARISHPTFNLAQANKGSSVYLLSTAFVCPLILVVYAAEVRHDDGDRQRNHQHAAQRADGAKDLPSNRLWYHVSIPKDETDEKSLSVDTQTYGLRCTRCVPIHQALSYIVISCCVLILSASFLLCFW